MILKLELNQGFAVPSLIESKFNEMGFSFEVEDGWAHVMKHPLLLR